MRILKALQVGELPARTIRDRAGIGLGRIYVILESMERRGFISRRMGEASPERGGCRRALYQLTAEGRHAAATQEADE